MKPNKEKLREVVKLLYVKELLGKPLFQELHLHPELQEDCNELIETAMQFELCVLNKKDYSQLKNQMKNQILSIHNIAKNLEKYRQSLLYFNENLEFVDLF